MMHSKQQAAHELYKFVGSDLEMICINSTQLYFHFSVGHICITDRYEVLCGGDLIASQAVPVIDGSIYAALDKSVTEVELTASGSVALKLSGETLLRFPASDRYQEWITYALKDSAKGYSSALQ